MKTLLSVFDYSGTWSEPFFRDGWEVIQWDIKLSELMDVNSIKTAGEALELFEDVDGLLFAPPCTHFTSSGAQYWKVKDEDGRTYEMLELVYQCRRLANLFRPTDPDFDGSFFWALENPVGRLPKLVPELGRAYYFDPCDFAGYTHPSPEELTKLERVRKKNGKRVTDGDIDLVIKLNAYTKKTCLFGEFNRDIKKKRLEPVKCCPQGSFTQRYGGDSIATKEARSNTPAGFAEAFFQANKDYCAHLDEDGEFISIYDL